MKTFITRLPLLLILVMFFSACNKEQDPINNVAPDYLPGKWKQITSDPELYYYFGSDGKFISDGYYYGSDARIQDVGTYTYSDSVITISYQLFGIENGIGSGQWNYQNTTMTIGLGVLKLNNRELTTTGNGLQEFNRVFE